MGGTTARVTGPRAPITQDQKRAGRSRDDQRQYRMGVCQKRGARPDMLAASGAVLEDIEHEGSPGGCRGHSLTCALGVGVMAAGLCLLPSRVLDVCLYSCCSHRVKSEWSGWTAWVPLANRAYVRPWRQHLVPSWVAASCSRTPVNAGVPTVRSHAWAAGRGRRGPTSLGKWATYPELLL